MESLTKNKKTDKEIVELLKKSQCLDGKVVEIEELTKGSFNAVYRVQLSNGNQCVLKIAPNPSMPVLRNEKNVMRSESDSLKLIRKHTSIPVPEVLHYSDDLLYCDSPFMIMQWMNGKDYQYEYNTYSDETNKNILFELGEMTYDFHKIKGNGFGALGENNAKLSNWKKAFSKLFQNLLEDGIDANVKLPFDYDYLFDLESKANPFLDDVKTPCLLHGDLWLGNVLVHNGKISALIDFERAVWGDPLMEYPFGLLRNNRNFLTGYANFIFDNSDVSVKIRRAIYNLYHHLIVVIEKPYRGFKSGASNYFVNQKIIAETKCIEKLF